MIRFICEGTVGRLRGTGGFCVNMDKNGRFRWAWFNLDRHPPDRHHIGSILKEVAVPENILPCILHLNTSTGPLFLPSRNANSVDFLIHHDKIRHNSAHLILGAVSEHDA